MNSKTCVVSVAFREPYLTHSKRQLEWIKANHPEVDTLYFWDELPAKDGIVKENIVEHFQKSLYGFKPHAIQRAIFLGYEKVIWLDPSVLPQSSLNVLIDGLNQYPVVVRQGENTLDEMTNDKALDYFIVSRKDANGFKHLAGTIYGFNFSSLDGLKVFGEWTLAEENGIFGTQDDFMKGHWADESCMALSLIACGLHPWFPSGFNYLNQKDFPL